MIDDPYRVLGIDQGASEAEIKKAYRKKAKEYHPDLHPNDPTATKKMNEVNEAYDMLMNPEKYAAQRAQQQRQSQQQNQTSRQTGQQGSGGWYSDFGEFSFEELFGFGFSGNAGEQPQRPREEYSDSPTIRRVVQAINNASYSYALELLTNVTSTGRSARWYYLSAVTNHHLGNTVTAMDHIQRAIRMDPENRTYQLLYRQYRQAEQTYERNAQGFDMGERQMQRMCMGFCLAQMFCNPFGCLRCM